MSYRYAFLTLDQSIFSWVGVAETTLRFWGADGVLRFDDPSTVRTVFVPAVRFEPAGATARSRPGCVAARAIAAFHAAVFPFRDRPTSTATRMRAVAPARLERADSEGRLRTRTTTRPTPGVEATFRAAPSEPASSVQTGTCCFVRAAAAGRWDQTTRCGSTTVRRL